MLTQQARGQSFAMDRGFSVQVIPGNRLPASTRGEIHQLCSDAYGEDLTHLFAAYNPDFHVLAFAGQKPVGHAMAVTRWLQAGHGPLMWTSYVEMVATAQPYQGLGIGTSLMRRLAEEAIRRKYDLAALCPADTGMYGHLGWEYWQGPLFIRVVEQQAKKAPALIPTPEERVMVLRLPGTPPLDLEIPLSAEWRAGGELR